MARQIEQVDQVAGQEDRSSSQTDQVAVEKLDKAAKYQAAAAACPQTSGPKVANWTWPRPSKNGPSGRGLLFDQADKWTKWQSHHWQSHHNGAAGRCSIRSLFHYCSAGRITEQHSPPPPRPSGQATSGVHSGGRL